MEFKAKPIKNPHKENYTKDQHDIAYKFAEEMYKEFGRFLSCVAMFGSSARNKAKNPHDIDILIVVDDLRVAMNPEVVQTYRIITDKMVAKISQKLHVTSMKLTSFWEYVRSGDPVAINILRDGISLIDNSFFDPLQVLLHQGRIRPSPEAIWSYFTRAPITIKNSKWHLLQATIDLYWAVIDAAHAILMKMGEIPPSPDHVADLIEKKLVKTNLLHKKHAQIMRNFYNLQKMIIHRDIKEIKGEEYDRYLADANEFLSAINELIEN